jgi:NDP-sugar pyrophosphorylase family protein
LQFNFKNFKNFELQIFPLIIKKFICRFLSIDGFWYAMDNIKDINVVNLRRNNDKRFFLIKKIIKKLND